MPSRYYVEIGSTPTEESCTQIGPDQHADQLALNRLECQAFISALRAKYGQEPPGCAFRIRTNAHDFGSYYEVCCDYDPMDEISRRYAFRAENGVATWHEVGMWPPITWTDKGEPTNILKHPESWFIATNPHCRPRSASTEAAG